MTKTRTIAVAIIISLLFLMNTIALADPSQTILDNLVLYLPYDEGAGAITNDMSGNGYHGMLFTQTDNQVNKWAQPVINDNHWTAGKWGNAIKFYNGTFTNNQNGDIFTKDILDTHIIGNGIYVEPWADNPSLGTKVAQDWSYSVWVRRPTDRLITATSSWINAWDVQPGKVLTQDETCVDWWTSNVDLRYDHLHTRYDGQYQVGTNRLLRTLYSAGGNPEYHAIGSPLGTYVNTASTGNGLWQNIIITVNGDPAGVAPNLFVTSVYVNGTLTTQKVYDTGAGWGYIPTEVVTIGSTTLKGIGMNDDVDDVGVWNRLLTSDEIAWIQSNPIKPTPPLAPTMVWPDNTGITNPNGKLTWTAGPSAPYASYDVYLSTSLQDVINGNRNPIFTCTTPPVGDIDDDCVVDTNDLELLVDCWLEPASCDPAANLLADSSIDLGDFDVLSGGWATSVPLTMSYHPAYKFPSQTGLEYNFTGLTAEQTYYWRIDGVKSDGQIGHGNIRNFIVKPIWKQTEFVNYMGWTNLGQYQESLKAPYAQDVYDLGIRHAQDSGSSIPYFYPKGVKVFLYYNPTPGSIAAQYRLNPGNAGYFQYDEPSQSSWSTVASYHNACRAADPSRPSYTNLLSSQGVGISGYDTYLQNFINTVNPEILSYDCYPYRYGWNHHWASLEKARVKALNLGIPLWNWQETCQGSQTTYPGSATNKNRLRKCVYTSLAYGVKGIAWFNIEMCFKILPDTLDPSYGSRTYQKRTPTSSPTGAYDDVKEVNAELNRIGQAMVLLTSSAPGWSTAVYHTNTSEWSGTTLLPSNFWVQVPDSNSGFVLGMFTDAQGGNYAMVSNKSDSVTVSNKQVTFQNTAISTVSVFNEQSGNWDGLTVQGSYPSQYIVLPSMGPGYGKLLKIN